MVGLRAFNSGRSVAANIKQPNEDDDDGATMNMDDSYCVLEFCDYTTLASEKSAQDHENREMKKPDTRLDAAADTTRDEKNISRLDTTTMPETRPLRKTYTHCLFYLYIILSLGKEGGFLLTFFFHIWMYIMPLFGV